MSLRERDQAVIWHPYTQMKTAPLPIPIVRGEGAYLIDEEGNRYLDAVSSWWVNLHGHAHPYIAQKVSEQLHTLEHVIFAGFTHPKAVELAERLLQRLPGQPQKLFYSDNGSTAVEVGLKMAFQYWYNQGRPRTRIVALENAYHGDTFGAMAASARSSFTAPFTPLLFDVDFIPLPTRNNLPQIKETLKHLLADHQHAAFLFEPLVQGAGGMLMYEPDLLDEILQLCRSHELLLIADEVMTGFGRTGKLFACDHLQHAPDIICLSKGLTGGFMAFGATSCTQAIYDAFLSEDKTKTFFHGHSYTGNPLACAAALASLDLVERPDFQQNLDRISAQHQQFQDRVQTHSLVRECRCQGTILALEFEVASNYSYFSQIRDHLYQFFLERKIICRPLGNVIYLIPPYCITNEELSYIYHAMEEAIHAFSTLT